MTITGVHALLYTSEPEAVRGILREVFGWRSVDAGGDWLIFALPPAELGVHPSDDGASHHELSLLCDDLTATLAQLRERGVEVRGEPAERGWGIVSTIVLPGGLDLLLYQPRHPTAI